MTDFLTIQNERHASALAEAFLTWERRGRGWQVWDYAVDLEPPFSRIKVAEQPIILVPDDARVQGGFVRFFGRDRSLQNTPRRLATSRSADISVDEKTTKPAAFYRSEKLTELRLLLPKDLDVSPLLSEQFFLSLSSCQTPVAFEILADLQAIAFQMTCDTNYAPYLKSQLQAFFPNSRVNEQTGILDLHLQSKPSTVIADFGLARNFLLPLQTFRSFAPDPLTGLISSLGSLQGQEKALLQILFQKTRLGWAEEAQKFAANPSVKTTVLSNQTLSSVLKDKLSSPLLAVVIRLVVQSESKQRSWEITKQIGGNFAQFSNPVGNELIALSNDAYSDNNHYLSVLNRTSYRSGMLLSDTELASLAHLPSSSVREVRLKRDELKTKAMPPLALGNPLILGENTHNGRSQPVTLSLEQRTRHTHLIGATGSGKSSLLLNLIKQDAESGRGLCLIESAGDLIDQVIANIPENRLSDVILFDPSDSEYPIGFNILQANSETEKTLLASDLVALFRRLSTSWGDVMDSVLANAVLAFVESNRGGTLFDLKRFLVEKDFRREFLPSVTDDSVRYFWEQEFPHIAGRPQTSILIRLDAFLRQKLIRNIVCQKENRLNFREIIDNRKILLVKLSQGAIGIENSHLLGSLIVSKLHQIALSRQDTSERPWFGLYADEFQNFVVSSLEGLLGGIRKYNLGLTLAHQEFRQLWSRSPEVANSVLSNCYTRICFRLGDADAERFAGGFSFFKAEDLQNLGIGEAIVRIERAEYDFNLRTFLVPEIPMDIAEKRRSEILKNTREQYATAKRNVEAELNVRPITDTNIEPIAAKAAWLSQKKVTRPTRNIKEQPVIQDSTPIEYVKTQSGADNPSSQHRYLQSLIKRMAESKGFRATIEKEIYGGIGKVDVSLENETSKIACEISVTNEVSYELQNIQKCLSAGYSVVMMISANKRHLDKIERMARQNTSTEDFAKIKFFVPEEFHVWLENVDTNETKEKVKGFKVKLKLKVVEEQERSTREHAISEVVFGSLKRLKNKSDDR